MCFRQLWHRRGGLLLKIALNNKKKSTKYVELCCVLHTFEMEWMKKHQLDRMERVWNQTSCRDPRNIHAGIQTAVNVPDVNTNHLHTTFFGSCWIAVLLHISTPHRFLLLLDIVSYIIYSLKNTYRVIVRVRLELLHMIHSRMGHLCDRRILKKISTFQFIRMLWFSSQICRAHKPGLFNMNQQDTNYTHCAGQVCIRIHR